MAGEIAIRHGIKGENAVYIIPAPDGQLLFENVSELFMNDRIQCCLAGWVEEYHQDLSSCLFLVERSKPEESTSNNMESIIFAPSNIERLFKEVL
jgi:hypothetical protein